MPTASPGPRTGSGSNEKSPSKVLVSLQLQVLPRDQRELNIWSWFKMQLLHFPSIFLQLKHIPKSSYLKTFSIG